MEKKTVFRSVTVLVLVAAGIGAILLVSRLHRRADAVRFHDGNVRPPEQLEHPTAEISSVDPKTATASHDEPALHSSALPGADTGPNRFVLKSAEVKSIREGLVTNLRFRPERTGPLGEMALIVRLPKNGEPRILKLEPTGEAIYSNVESRVSENGKFAIFLGVPSNGVEDIGFALSVSAPATADVRGIGGIEPFSLNISPDGASTSAPAY